MADEHHGAGAHHGPDFGIYMVVFIALSVFTLISFIVNAIFGIGSLTGMAIIMIVAVCKATLVVMYFMHVKYDWGKLYFLIIPVVIMAIMVIVVLLPDTVLYWHHD